MYKKSKWRIKGGGMPCYVGRAGLGRGKTYGRKIANACVRWKEIATLQVNKSIT